MGLPELALALRWPFWGFHAMQSTSYSGHLGCFACWWCGTSITHFLAKTSLLDRSTKVYAEPPFLAGLLLPCQRLFPPAAALTSAANSQEWLLGRGLRCWPLLIMLSRPHGPARVGPAIPVPPHGGPRGRHPPGCRAPFF